MAVRGSRNRKASTPLDRTSLGQLALRYVGRYATTRARLADYLGRKLHERGWGGSGEPPIDAIADHMVELGYVDDQAYASARAASLGRRGYGLRRVSEALRSAGIADEDSVQAREQALARTWQAAMRLAERRRIGPFAECEPDRAGRERALGILLRAGHPVEIARRLAFARPGEFPEESAT